MGLGLSACIVEPSLNGKACDAEHPCIDGYACVASICRMATDGGRFDGGVWLDGGGRFDGGGDGERDSGADDVDGGRDGGVAIDGGTSDDGGIGVPLVAGAYYRDATGVRMGVMGTTGLRGIPGPGPVDADARLLRYRRVGSGASARELLATQSAGTDPGLTVQISEGDLWQTTFTSMSAVAPGLAVRAMDAARLGDGSVLVVHATDVVGALRYALYRVGAPVAQGVVDFGGQVPPGGQRVAWVKVIPSSFFLEAMIMVAYEDGSLYATHFIDGFFDGGRMLTDGLTAPGLPCFGGAMLFDEAVLAWGTATGPSFEAVVYTTSVGAWSSIFTEPMLQGLTVLALDVAADVSTERVVVAILTTPVAQQRAWAIDWDAVDRSWSVPDLVDVFARDVLPPAGSTPIAARFYGESATPVIAYASNVLGEVAVDVFQRVGDLWQVTQNTGAAVDFALDQAHVQLHPSSAPGRLVLATSDTQQLHAFVVQPEGYAKLPYAPLSLQDTGQSGPLFDMTLR